MFLPSSEFQPGVPWKGIDRVDPESDPYMTPGSMMGNTASPGLNDPEHQLLQDNTGKWAPVPSSSPPVSCLTPVVRFMEEQTGELSSWPEVFFV